MTSALILPAIPPAAQNSVGPGGPRAAVHAVAGVGPAVTSTQTLPWAGGEVSRRSHKPEEVGSIPTPNTDVGLSDAEIIIDALRERIIDRGGVPAIGHLSLPIPVECDNLPRLVAFAIDELGIWITATLIGCTDRRAEYRVDWQEHAL